MITLRTILEDEFRAFKKFSVADYAADLMKGQNTGSEQACRFIVQPAFDQNSMLLVPQKEGLHFSFA